MFFPEQFLYTPALLKQYFLVIQSCFLQFLFKDQLKMKIKQICLFRLIHSSIYSYILIFFSASLSFSPCNILKKYISIFLLNLASVQFCLSLAQSSPSILISPTFLYFQCTFFFFPSELSCTLFLNHIGYFIVLSFFSGIRVV